MEKTVDPTTQTNHQQSSKEVTMTISKGLQNKQRPNYQKTGAA